MSLLWRGTRGRGTHALEMPAVGEASPGETGPQTTVTARHGRRAPRDAVSSWKILKQQPGQTRDRVIIHAHSAATAYLKMSCRTRGSGWKHATMTMSWPGLTEPASATRTQGSEEQAVASSSASTTTETAPSPCLDESRPTIVQSCWP